MCWILGNAVQWSSLLLICWCQFFLLTVPFVCSCLSLITPSPLSTCGWVLISIYQTLHWGSQCDGVWWLPLTGLSWLPASALACNSISLSRHFPHSHLLLMGLHLKWTDLFKIVVYNKHSACTGTLYREFKLHVYDKQQMAHSGWEFRKIENEEVKTVQKILMD